MIKHYSITLLTLGLASAIVAQPTLTTSNALPAVGTEYPVTHGSAFVWSGAEGDGVTYGFWNDLPADGTRTYYILDPSASPSSATIGGLHHLITDGGTDTTFWRSTANGLELAGEFFSGLALFNYSDPALELQLPLSYGDEWTDDFVGNASTQLGPAVRTGTVDGWADSHGMLELPASAYPSVLRVHLRKTSTVTSNILNGSSASDHWYFYDGVVPYPVLKLMIDTIIIGSGAPTVQKRAEWIGEAGNVGYQEIDPELVQFIAFPNPADEDVTIQTSTETTIASIEVIGHTGQVVRELRPAAQNERTQIDVASLAPGHYLLRITDASGVRSTRPLVIH
jgi:hypothetical protein